MATMTMTKCPQCGKYSVPGPANCEQCGTSLRGAARVEVDQSTATTGASPAGVVPVNISRVVVTDFDMPFGSMVMFMAKWALASIPAFLVLFVLGMILFSVLTGLNGIPR